MNFWYNLVSLTEEYLTISSITVNDIIEILIIAIIFYIILMWVRKTRAWSLFRGVLVIGVALLLVSIFQFDTLFWLVTRAIYVVLFGLVILFQPELRRILTQLGQGKFFRRFFTFSNDNQRITNENISEIIGAVYAMSREHTGALICLERDVELEEYVVTGIRLDSEISRQLLVNIFENKTPLHDGAVIISDDRIEAATCYLPMSENLNVNKKYGTRHRAALGLSEETDAFIIVVSEETGSVSLALGGELIEDVKEAELQSRLDIFQNDGVIRTTGRFKRGKGRKDEGKNKTDSKEISDK